jgi:hypothetical protein
VTYWQTFTDGGHIRPDFMSKLRAMLNIAIRDGPLLNFCKLGHLSLTAVPFAGSGLGDADVKKVQELQTSLVQDVNLPLGAASSDACEELGRLYNEVRGVIVQSSGDEKVMLNELREAVKRANDHCPSSQQLPPSPTEESSLPPSPVAFDDDAYSYNPLSSQPAVRNRITSGVVNQIDITRGQTPPVHPRFSNIREPSRRSTLSAFSLTERDRSETSTGPVLHLQTLTETGPPSTSLTGPTYARDHRTNKGVF